MGESPSPWALYPEVYSWDQGQLRHLGCMQELMQYECWVPPQVPIRDGQGGMPPDQFRGSQMEGYKEALGMKGACKCLEISVTSPQEAHGALFRVWKTGLLVCVSLNIGSTKNLHHHPLRKLFQFLPLGLSSRHCDCQRISRHLVANEERAKAKPNIEELCVLG